METLKSLIKLYNESTGADKVFYIQKIADELLRLFSCLKGYKNISAFVSELYNEVPTNNVERLLLKCYYELARGNECKFNIRIFDEQSLNAGDKTINPMRDNLFSALEPKEEIAFLLTNENNDVQTIASVIGMILTRDCFLDGKIDARHDKVVSLESFHHELELLSKESDAIAIEYEDLMNDYDIGLKASVSLESATSFSDIEDNLETIYNLCEKHKVEVANVSLEGIKNKDSVSMEGVGDAISKFFKTIWEKIKALFGFSKKVYKKVEGIVSGLDKEASELLKEMYKLKYIKENNFTVSETKSIFKEKLRDEGVTQLGKYLKVTRKDKVDDLVTLPVSFLVTSFTVNVALYGLDTIVKKSLFNNTEDDFIYYKLDMIGPKYRCLKIPNENSQESLAKEIEIVTLESKNKKKIDNIDSLVTSETSVSKDFLENCIDNLEIVVEAFAKFDKIKEGADANLKSAQDLIDSLKKGKVKAEGKSNDDLKKKLSSIVVNIPKLTLAKYEALLTYGKSQIKVSKVVASKFSETDPSIKKIEN